MCVDCDGRLAERRVEHHVCGLAADAGKRLQCGAVARHLATVQIDQRLARFDDVARFGVVETDVANVGGETFHAEREHRCRRVGDGIELLGSDVDADVRLRPWADRMTAINSSNGDAYSSSVSGAGVASRSRSKMRCRFSAFIRVTPARSSRRAADLQRRRRMPEESTPARRWPRLRTTPTRSSTAKNPAPVTMLWISEAPIVIAVRQAPPVPGRRSCKGRSEPTKRRADEHRRRRPA